MWFLFAKNLEDWSYLCARNLGAIGMTKKDVFQNTTSAGLFTGGFGYAQGCTVLGAMLIPFGPGLTSRQLEFFKTFKVTAFHAIPSFGLRIAQVIEDDNIKKELKEGLILVIPKKIKSMDKKHLKKN